MDDPKSADSALIRSFLLHRGAVGSTRTATLYGEILELFSQWLENQGHRGGLATVKRRDASSWFAEQRAAGLSGNTIRNRWVALRSFFKWLTDEEEIEENPLAKLTVPKPDVPPPDVLTVDELAALLKACAGASFKNRRDFALVRLMAGTGLRVSEVAAIQAEDIDLAHRILVVPRGKGDRKRMVRIDPETAASLDRYQRVRARHRLARLEGYWIGHRGVFGAKGIRTMLATRSEEAGIRPVNPHQLRHTYAHLWLQRGGNEGDLQMLGGWESPQVMRRYGSALARDRALAAADDVDVLGGI
jgi:site-specific recombinase XerD